MELKFCDKRGATGSGSVPVPVAVRVREERNWDPFGSKKKSVCERWVRVWFGWKVWEGRVSRMDKLTFSIDGASKLRVGVTPKRMRVVGDPFEIRTCSGVLIFHPK